MRKQAPLRMSEELWAEIERWAEDDFRSVNGQIEYLLSECVKYRRKGKTAVGINEREEAAIVRTVVEENKQNKGE